MEHPLRGDNNALVLKYIYQISDFSNKIYLITIERNWSEITIVLFQSWTIIIHFFNTCDTCTLLHDIPVFL